MHCVNEGRQETPAQLTRVLLSGSDDEGRWEPLNLKSRWPCADMSLHGVDGSRSSSWPCAMLNSNGVRGPLSNGLCCGGTEPLSWMESAVIAEIHQRISAPPIQERQTKSSREKLKRNQRMLERIAGMRDQLKGAKWPRRPRVTFCWWSQHHRTRRHWCSRLMVGAALPTSNDGRQRCRNIKHMMLAAIQGKDAIIFVRKSRCYPVTTPPRCLLNLLSDSVAGQRADDSESTIGSFVWCAILVVRTHH